MSLPRAVLFDMDRTIVDSVEATERLLMGAHFAQLHVHLDPAAVELAVGLGAAGGDLGLGPLLGLLRRHRGLAAGHFDQLGGVLGVQGTGARVRLDGDASIRQLAPATSVYGVRQVAPTAGVLSNGAGGYVVVFDDVTHVLQARADDASFVEHERDPWRHHPVEPAQEDGGARTPPGRVDEDERLCLPDEVGVRGVITGTITVRTSAKPEHVHIEVSDTGSGLTCEECERLFTPYYTTKRHGTGLGLAIVQSVVSDHGGSISTSSATEMMSGHGFPSAQRWLRYGLRPPAHASSHLSHAQQTDWAGCLPAPAGRRPFPTAR